MEAKKRYHCVLGKQLDFFHSGTLCATYFSTCTFLGYCSIDSYMIYRAWQYASEYASECDSDESNESGVLALQ